MGRWSGATVSVHLFFLLFAVLTLALTLGDADLAVPGALTVGVLLASVLLHELAHAWAAIRCGGRVDAIVLGPAGGLVAPRVPDEPEVHLFVALAGPLVHLTLVVLAAIVLAAEGQSDAIGLLNPVAAPTDLVDTSAWLVAAKLMLWLNWILLLLNLLPAFPFDGGPALRAALWPALGRRTARIVTSRVAMTIALLLCASSLLTWGMETDAPIPVWVPLVMLGLFLFFSAQQDVAAGEAYELADELAGYRKHGDGEDLLDDIWPIEEDDDGVLVEHRGRPHLDQNRRAQEAYEDAQVDDILARLHNSSWDALTREEIDLLQRASQRYKLRRGLPRES